MKIAIPAKIKEELANIASVWVDLDDSRITPPSNNTKSISAPKEHIALYDWLDIFDEHYTNCTSLKYRVVYNDGTEEIMGFEDKQGMEYRYQVYREYKDFKDILPQATRGWCKGRGPVSSTFQYAKGFNEILVPEKELQAFTASVNLPESGVLTLNDGLVSTKGLVYSHTGSCRYLELTRFSSIKETNKHDRELTIYQNKKLDTPCNFKLTKYNRGSCLNLYGLFSNYNFCHGFLDICGMLNSANTVGVNFQSYDWYIVPSNRYKLTLDLFKKLKIDSRKFLNAGEMKNADGEVEINNYSFLFDELSTPSFNGFCGFYAPGAFDFVRDLYRDEINSGKQNRRIYLSRENFDRSIINEIEVIQLLEAYNFEILHSSNQLDVPRIMSEASVVVGAHGAAMANCVFCSNGTKLIDLMPTTHIYPYFMSLSQCIGMEYFPVFSKSCSYSVTEGEEKKYGKALQVNIAGLKQILDELL